MKQSKEGLKERIETIKRKKVLVEKVKTELFDLKSYLSEELNKTKKKIVIEKD